MSLSYDLRDAERTLIAADEALGAVIGRVGACVLQVEPLVDPYRGLFRSIVYQQVSGKAASTILGRVLALAPEGMAPERFLGLSEESLRGAGLSRNKLAALRDLSEKTVAGVIPRMDELHHLPDDEIISRLSEVRGIGRWTVEMLLIFNLGRPDVLPSTDLGVRKGFQLMTGVDVLPPPRALEAHAERWRPYRSIASWYLWRLVDGEGGAW